MKKKALFILDASAYDVIYGPEERKEIEKRVELIGPAQTRESILLHPELLKQVEFIFSGWGAPKMDEAFLACAPRLEAIFYGAGSIRYFTTDAFWDRNIVVTSAYAANAVPVSEFTLAQILFSLKRGWYFIEQMKSKRMYRPLEYLPGAFGSTVGIISLGVIGRMVVQKLRQFDLKILAYDPFISKAAAEEMGVELCSLEELFQRSDVVSLHAPELPATRHMITGKLLASMKHGATFINTARGSIVNEEEMIEVLQKRKDLVAALDVTEVEPPVEVSPLYSLPNVVLTPHIAGSLDRECLRMGRYMLDELDRYLKGQPLIWQITREKAAIMA